MPLSETGEKVKRKFKQEYGKEGEGYFYAKENKDKKFAEAVKKGDVATIMAMWLEAAYGKSQIVDPPVRFANDFNYGSKAEVKKKPYGNVEYADPGYHDNKERYPVDPKHIHAAWNYINHPKNAHKYTSSQLHHIRNKIIAAYKRHVDSAGPPSLTKCALLKSRPIKYSMEFQGFPISVEFERGDIRKHKDGQTKMLYPYGYIEFTKGQDGEPLDAYVGPDSMAEYVYEIKQLKADTGKFDEMKYMLGFDSPEEAKRAYISHYNPNFFGGIKAISLEDFKQQI